MIELELPGCYSRPAWIRTLKTIKYKTNLVSTLKNTIIIFLTFRIPGLHCTTSCCPIAHQDNGQSTHTLWHWSIQSSTSKKPFISAADLTELNYFHYFQNGHTAQSIARQLGRPSILGALKRSNKIDADQPLDDWCWKSVGTHTNVQRIMLMVFTT